MQIHKIGNQMQKSISVSDGCQSYMLRVSLCDFCLIALLFFTSAMRMRMNFHCRSAIRFGGRFRATLLLRTTCMRSCCNWRACSVVV